MCRQGRSQAVVKYGKGSEYVCHKNEYSILIQAFPNTNESTRSNVSSFLDQLILVFNISTYILSRTDFNKSHYSFKRYPTSHISSTCPKNRKLPPVGCDVIVIFTNVLVSCFNQYVLDSYIQLNTD